MTGRQEPDGPRLEDADGNRIEIDIDEARAFREAVRNRTREPSGPLTMWWTLSRPNGGGVHLRLTLNDRWTLTDVYLHGPALAASDLQAVPVTDLDLLLNLTDDFEGFDPWTAAEAFNDLAAKTGWGQTALVVDQDEEDDPQLSELRALAAAAPPTLPQRPRAERPRLTRPDGTDPEGFAERVAAAYREYAGQTRAPAVEIANEAGVPIATVRSWIREARRRGKLPQGRKGKAG